MLLKCSPPLTHLFNFEKDRCKFAFNNKYFKRSYTVGPSNAPFTFQTNCKVAPAVEFIFTYSAGRNLIDLLETTSSHLGNNTAQGVKIPIEYFFNKCDQIHSFLRIWSHLLKKTLMENFFFFVQCNHFSGKFLMTGRIWIFFLLFRSVPYQQKLKNHQNVVWRLTL